MATSSAGLREGTDKNIATYSFTEDGQTKHLQRVSLASSDGTSVTDSSTGVKVTLGTKIAGEDLTNDVIKSETRGSSIAISTATTTTAKSGAGHLNTLRCVGGTLGNVTVYDNTAASGTVLLPTVTPVANGVLLENIDFSTGITIVTAAATVLTGSYR